MAPKIIVSVRRDRRTNTIFYRYLYSHIQKCYESYSFHLTSSVLKKANKASYIVSKILCNPLKLEMKITIYFSNIFITIFFFAFRTI